MLKLRRSMTALTGAAVLVLGGAPGALAQDGEGPDGGLYGTEDPTFDGVLRQATALLALHAAERTPPEAAVEWLVGQQCEDGSFTAFRADPDAPCDDAEMRDTNATATAVQALAALGGQDEAVGSGVAWLRSLQDEEGRWPYAPGETGDANSTALAIGALTAAGEDASDAITALNTFQFGCAADEEIRGGYFYKPEDAEAAEPRPNTLATVDAVLAAQGSGLLVEPAGASGTPSAPECEGPDDELSDEEAAAAGAAYLQTLLSADEPYLTSEFAEGPDYGSTTRAVLALAAGGYGESARAPLAWLAENHGDWAGHENSPAALGQLILAAHATGGDPADFGGTDLPAALAALGPAEDEAPAEDGEGAGDGDDGGPADGDEPPGDTVAEEDDDSAAWVVWLIVVGLLAGIGIGVVVSLRRRNAGGGAEGTGPAAATGEGAAAIGGTVAATGGAAAPAAGAEDASQADPAADSGADADASAGKAAEHGGASGEDGDGDGDADEPNRGGGRG